MKNKTIEFLMQVSGKTKINIVFLTLIQIILGVTSVLYALSLRDIINGAVEKDKTAFFTALVLFAALVCVQLALRAVTRWLDEKTRSELENRFKSKLFGTVLSKDFDAVTAVHSGEWLNRLTSDTVVVANGLTQIIPNVSGMAVKLIGAVIMIIAIEPRFCFLVVPFGLLLIVFSYAFRKKIKKLHKEMQEQDGKTRTFMQDILSSMLVVRSYAVQNDSIENAEEKMLSHKKARMKKKRFSNFCNIGFGAVMNGAYVVGAGFCGYGILTGTMSYGTFMAVLQLIGQIQAPFANISGFLPQWYAMLASAERIMEAENFDEQNEKCLSSGEIQTIYQNGFENIGLDNASFTYQPPVIGSEQTMPVVLHNISLEISKGEYVAFTGHSGCGKSTVMKLLLALYRLDKGERYIQINGERQTLDSKYQRLFAYVPQGNHLMSGTIREIIAMSDKLDMNNDERIDHALKISCADEFVNELENGADTVLGERGQGLSEGQMQRIAIARAIFSDCPILLLDESTSALDEQTEKKLLTNLHSMTDKTVVIVTHRPAALEICDKIIEFTEKGCEIK